MTLQELTTVLNNKYTSSATLKKGTAKGRSYYIAMIEYTYGGKGNIVNISKSTFELIKHKKVTKK